MPIDIVGEAVFEYANNLRDDCILVLVDGEIDQKLSPGIFFRRYKNMSLVERRALKLCRGSVLDVGAGAGAHAIYLQARKFNVTALEKSKLACTVLTKRGVQKVVHSDVLRFKGNQFDSILLLMNGLGIMGDVPRTIMLLKHLKTLLTPGGQILADSAVIDHLYSASSGAGSSRADYRKVEFTLKFKNKVSKPFGWIYFRYAFLKRLCIAAGLKCKLVLETKKSGYLVRITR